MPSTKAPNAPTEIIARAIAAAWNRDTTRLWRTLNELSDDDLWWLGGTAQDLAGEVRAMQRHRFGSSGDPR